MAQSGCPGRRGRYDERAGDGAGIGDLSTSGQHLPALRLRSLGSALATARGYRRHGDRALCGRHRGRLRARGRRPTLSRHDARAVGRVCADTASGEDPADHVRPLRSGATCQARARQTGNVRFPWLHSYLRTDPAGPVPNPSQKSAGPPMGEAAEIKDELRRRILQPIAEQGRWLKLVITGYYAYHAVPTNSRSLGAFRDHVIRLWGRTLRRRSQKHTLTWERMGKVADDWLPQPRILHPWPSIRFAVKHLR